MKRRGFLRIVGIAAGVSTAGCMGTDDESNTENRNRNKSDKNQKGDGTGNESESKTRNRSQDDNRDGGSKDGNKDDDEGGTGIEPSVNVKNQTVSDGSITVSGVSIDKKGWIVIHPEGERGPDPETVLGKKFLERGEYSNIEIELKEEISESRTLFGMLHYDDPQDGEFTFPDEGDPAVSSDGGTVINPFKVEVSGPTPSITVEDQEIEDGSITVSRASIDQKGWVVIHPMGEDGTLNSKVIIGKKLLEPGKYTEIEVNLGSSISEDQTLFGMIHYDDPQDGEFTFPDEGDPAVKVNGDAVIKSFEVEVPGPNPSIEVKDQTTDGDTVTVTAASIDEEGWLVVHPESVTGEPKDNIVLAKKFLKPGKYTDVEMSLGSSISESQTLFGILYYDDPQDGELTFGTGEDPPVKVGNNTVVSSFKASIESSTGFIKQIDMKNTEFRPMKAQIEPGTTVRWVNKDSYAHDIKDAKFHDKAEDWKIFRELSADEETTYTFGSEGVYEYYCTIHGQSVMCGAVIVGDVSLDQSLPCER